MADDGGLIPFVGTWDGSTFYRRNECVLRTGVLYQATTDRDDGRDPALGGPYWTSMAAVVATYVGTADPTAGGGIPAAEGSTYQMAAGGLYVKGSGAATDWAEGGGSGIPQGGPLTEDLDADGHKITGLDPGVADTDAATVGQLGGRWVDLGLLDFTDPAIYGVPLVELAEDERIASVRFLPDGYEVYAAGTDAYFFTPNIMQDVSTSYGWAYTAVAGDDPPYDTLGMVYSGTMWGLAGNGEAGFILGDSPLSLRFSGQTEFYGEHIAWPALTPVTLADWTIGEGHIQGVTTAGTTGASEPDWNTISGTTEDGSAVWADYGLFPTTGKLRVVVEVWKLTAP